MVRISSRLSWRNTIVSSTRFRNSGLKCCFSSCSTVVFIRSYEPRDSPAVPKPTKTPLVMSRVPRLVVMMITVFLKSTTRPCASVRRPSSRICSSELKMSGWASRPSCRRRARRPAPGCSWCAGRAPAPGPAGTLRAHPLHSARQEGPRAVAAVKRPGCSPLGNGHLVRTGRPVRRGWARFPVTRPRCHRRTVPGVTSWCARSLPGRSLISAASTARWAQSHRAPARCGAAPRPRATARAVPHP